jgi:hypothetical protein
LIIHSFIVAIFCNKKILSFKKRFQSFILPTFQGMTKRHTPIC